MKREKGGLKRNGKMVGEVFWFIASCLLQSALTVVMFKCCSIQPTGPAPLTLQFEFNPSFSPFPCFARLYTRNYSHMLFANYECGGAYTGILHSTRIFCVF